MSGIEIFLAINLMVCTAGVIAMCFVYQSLENSFRIHLRFLAEMRRDLMELRFGHIGREHGAGIPSMAEDTEVAE